MSILSTSAFRHCCARPTASLRRRRPDVALYVLALTDTDLGTWMTGGRRLYSANCNGIHVAHERRVEAPPVSDEELRAQHALVTAIAERAPAVLPARFGASRWGSVSCRRRLTGTTPKSWPRWTGFAIASR